MLLHYANLEPIGPSNLASIRFSSQVTIQCIRFFPKGMSPFVQKLEIMSLTEPSAFYVNVLFHTQPLCASDKKKQKANALLPTVLAYPGGLVDFPVNMGIEHGTRLMIATGNFKKLSLAIYGEVVAEHSTDSTQNKEHFSPRASIHSVMPALDPLQWVDPLCLSRSLLEISHERTSISLITQLMFCLKPSTDDWNEPDFPHLFANIGNRNHRLDIKDAIEITSRPIATDIDQATVESFAMQLVSSINVAGGNEQNLIAKLLAQTASQQADLSRTLISNLNLRRLINIADLDNETLQHLLDACANPDICRGFIDQGILGMLKSSLERHLFDDQAEKIVKRLCDRVIGWSTLQNALSGVCVDFSFAVRLVKDVVLTENSLGIWLVNIFTQLDLLDKMLEASISRQQLSDIWFNNNVTSREDFFCFLRAFIGISAVVAVYAWADSVPIDDCRERSLAILRLWHDTQGFDEIIDNLLLLRQMTFRLECMLPLVEDPPSQVAIDAEHMLSILALKPSSMLREEFIQVIRSLRPPLTFITDEQAMAFRYAADMAEKGLVSAMTTLKTKRTASNHGLLLSLRVAVAMLGKELEDYQNFEWRYLHSIGEDSYSANGMTSILIDRLVEVGDDVQYYFSLNPSLSYSIACLSDVIRLLDELLKLLVLFLSAQSVCGRELVIVTRALANIFVCSDAADDFFFRDSNASKEVTSTRQSCLNCIDKLLASDSYLKEGRNTVVVLKIILENAIQSHDHDAIHHLMQHLWLLDHILPAGSGNCDIQVWAANVIPEILMELHAFFNLLEVKHKVYVLKRLIALDNSVVGVGEWFLAEMLKDSSQSITLNERMPYNDVFNFVMARRVEAHVQVFLGLMISPECSTWCLNALQGPTVCSPLLQFFKLLLDGNVIYPDLLQVVQQLSASCRSLSADMASYTLRVLLLLSRTENVNALNVASHMLESVSFANIVTEPWLIEIGATLQVAANLIQETPSSSPDIKEPLSFFLRWITSVEFVELPGIDFMSYNKILNYISADRCSAERVRLIGGQLIAPVFFPSVHDIEIPLYKWEELLSSLPPLPSTPQQSGSSKMEVFGLVNTSPPTALLRSPEVKGLTKTYSNNDFRQLRQTAASRQNTSRLPSMHVDEFELDNSTVVVQSHQEPAY